MVILFSRPRNESRSLRLMFAPKVKSGTSDPGGPPAENHPLDHQQPSGHHRAVSRDQPLLGNQPPMPGIFPNYSAPMVRNIDTGRELTMMRWGMPPPPRGWAIAGKEIERAPVREPEPL
jgi:hypothetical protein